MASLKYWNGTEWVTVTAVNMLQGSSAGSLAFDFEFVMPVEKFLVIDNSIYE